jgi:hypothetical protein
LSRKPLQQTASFKSPALSMMMKVDKWKTSFSQPFSVQPNHRARLYSQHHFRLFHSKGSAVFDIIKICGEYQCCSPNSLPWRRTPIM